jgi:hypothetical protein
MIEFEFRNVDFCEGRKTGEPAEKNPRSKGENQQKLNSHMTPSPRIEPEITMVRGERLAATPPMIPKQVFVSSTTFYFNCFTVHE